MSENAESLPVPSTTFADLVWPARAGTTAFTRGVLLSILGACLLTISAKIQVPGPIPMTLQTLAVMAIGAVLGMRLAVASVALYALEGIFGLPVFANTPPMVPSLAYLLGPTGGFLLGFAAAAAIVGSAADRGLIKRPLAFAAVLAFSNVVLLTVGCLWLALFAQIAGGTGLGFAKAFELGVKPFILANTLKLGLAAIAIPLVYETLSRFVRR